MVLGRSRPKKWIGPISAQKTIILFWARPGPEDWAGPGPAWPSNKRWRGGLFSPHPPACRTLFVLHAEKKKCSNEGRKKNYLARRRLCVPGGAAAEAGGGVVAHGRRLQAALRLFRMSGSFSPFLPFSSFLVCFFPFVCGFFFPLFPFLFSVFFGSSLFLLSPSFYLFFRVFLFPSLSSVFSVFSSPPFIAAVLFVIYRAK